MNQADNFRNVQEQRYLVDRAIPGVDYGKGCEYQSSLFFVVVGKKREEG